MNEDQVREIVRQMLENSDTVNQFSVAQTPFHTHNGIDSQLLRFIKLADVPTAYFGFNNYPLAVNSTATGVAFRPVYELEGNYGIIAKSTNGTTNVDVFTSAGAPMDFTVTGVFLTALDATAGDITVINGTNTVCTIAKGTTSGAMVGAGTLSNTTVTTGSIFQVDSSSAGNARVFITYTT